MTVRTWVDDRQDFVLERELEDGILCHALVQRMAVPVIMVPIKHLSNHIKSLVFT